MLSSPIADGWRLGAPPGLPMGLTALVGRAGDQARVTELLDHARLVTLTGPAGVGKTRLALEVAAGSPVPAYLVDLATLDDPALVARSVAEVLGIPEQAGWPLVETMSRRLAGAAVMILLDNCEHVVEACADLVAALLRSCAPVRALVTSREPLGVEGEQVHVVAPLPVPAPGEDPVSGRACHSVELFLARAATVAPAFELTPALTPEVAEICRRVDGVPLALELAAARVGVLAPAQIVERLDDCLALLSGGTRSAPRRHRSLLAALEWGHRLLSGEEQILLRRLSVFPGPVSLEVVEDVCSGDGLPATRVLDLLGALVSKSLVVADTSGFEARYRLLNTVRQFGAGKLTAADEVERLRKSLETITVPIRGRGPTRRRPRAGPSSLTPAELAVVRLVAEGLTNKEIGGHLRVSARTVQTHLAHVFDKLGVRSRREVAYATRGYSSATAADVPTSPAG